MARIEVDIIKKYYITGSSLLKARESNGMSQLDLAVRLGFWTQQNISLIEKQMAIRHEIERWQLDIMNKVLI
jgi:transcriptional regulator